MPAVWGWSEPGSPSLRHIQLQNNADNISLNGLVHRSRRNRSTVQQLRQSLQHHRVTSPAPHPAARRCHRHLIRWSDAQVKKELFDSAAAQTEPAAPSMWGWLEPGSPSLPHIQLQGNAVALGRGTGRQSIDTKSEEIAKAHPAPEPSSPASYASPSVAASPRQVPEALLSSGCLCQQECAVRHCLFCSCAVAVQTPPELSPPSWHAKTWEQAGNSCKDNPVASTCE